MSADKSETVVWFYEHMMWDDLREVGMIKFSSDGFQDPKLEQILVIFPFND